MTINYLIFKATFIEGMQWDAARGPFDIFEIRIRFSLLMFYFCLIANGRRIVKEEHCQI